MGSAGIRLNKCALVLAILFISVFCGAATLPGCTQLLDADSRFVGCQELSEGESAVLWAANGSDAITVKYMLTDGPDMGWMGLGLNVHGSMKGRYSRVPYQWTSCSMINDTTIILGCGHIVKNFQGRHMFGACTAWLAQERHAVVPPVATARHNCCFDEHIPS
jgi:hypothetical protein